jgi:hydroxymethylglutaryl-CoA lyase
MAQDDLVGNIATENLAAFCFSRNIPLPFDIEKLWQAGALADEVFRH